jgi:hypothetical protein
MANGTFQSGGGAMRAMPYLCEARRARGERHSAHLTHGDEKGAKAAHCSTIGCTRFMYVIGSAHSSLEGRRSGASAIVAVAMSTAVTSH